MPDVQHNSEVFVCITDPPGEGALDVFGPTIEFVSWSEDPLANFCVIRGVVPPGVTVPLHSHDDVEDFFIVAGTQQVLVDGPGGLQWRDAHAGDYVRVPGGVPHAHRNVSDQPAIDLIVTTTRIGRFFKEVGRPVTASLQSPTPEELAHFAAAATRYGYRLGTPQDNAAVGIDLPGLPA